MKRLKRVISIFLILIIVVGFSPAISFRSEAAEKKESWLWPSESCFEVSSNFGYRETKKFTKWHTGVDIPATAGSAVRASRSGTVVEAISDGTPGGKTAIMTVYLTPRIYETPQAQKGEAILWVKNVIKDSERRADFYFVLTEEGTENSQLISISGNGEAAFPTLCYTTAGTYRYTVCQVIGTEPYQYDDGVYTATVTVADDLSTEVSYMYDGRAAEEIVFNNDWNETGASAALATPTDAAYLTAAGIAVSGLEDGGSYAEGDTFTVTSAKACVAAISFDGGESYTELPASPTADENTYTFTLPALTGDFVIGIVLLGDANGDGKVNTADGLRIQRYITFDPDDPYESNYELTALTELAADANGDGKVNTADVLRIQRHITFDPDDPYESNYELCWNVAS